MVPASLRSLLVSVPRELASVMSWDWIGAGHAVCHRIGGGAGRDTSVRANNPAEAPNATGAGFGGVASADLLGGRGSNDLVGDAGRAGCNILREVRRNLRSDLGRAG
jgi:hypothetical protein